MAAAVFEAAWALMDAGFAALEALDATGVDDADQHAHVLRLNEATSRLASVRAEATGEWVARGMWADDGSRAPWARLGRECSLSTVSAKREVGRAKKLRSMPATAAAFGEGKLSVDQVDLLCTALQQPISSVFERDETMLVSELPGLRMRDAQKFIDYWIERAYTEVDVERSRPDPAGRRWRAVRTFDGHVDAGGWLDPIAGTEYLTELEAIEQELFHADVAAARDGQDPQLPRTAAQRKADAQVEMARRAAAYRQGTYRKPDPLITVHVGLATVERMCELADGMVVSPGQVFPLLERADIERIVFDSPSRVLDVGVRERFFTGALRRAIEARDKHCQHPSECDVPADRCQIDHRDRYADGGETTQVNGRCMCGFHNRDLENHPEHDSDQLDDPDQRPPPDPDGQ